MKSKNFIKLLILIPCMYRCIFALLFCLIVFSSAVAGYGMASEFLENNVMILHPGETKEYRIELQNTEDADMRFRFNLESDIARIKDNQTEYVVGKGKPFQSIAMIISMPEDAKPGEEHFVRYSAVPVSESEGPVRLNVKLNNEFRVVVPGQKDSFGPNYPGIVTIIFLMLIIIVVMFRKNSVVSKRFLR